MDPIIFANAAWIDNVTQVVSGIRDNKVGVGNRIVPVARVRLLGYRNPGSLLDCIESSRGSSEANKTSVEIV